MKRLSGIGVWTWLDGTPTDQAVEAVRQMEAWGYTALWLPEAVGKDPFALISYLAGKTERITLCTGIANIYARDPMTLKALHRTVADVAPGRFVMAIGVSHGHLVGKVRGHEYEKPVPKMRRFLEEFESALYIAPEPAEPAPILIGALRDRMLALSGEATQGAHPYLVPPEHTARARGVLGAEPWLCPEQKVVLEEDVEKVRAVARPYLKTYTRLPNYQNNLKQFGFEDADFEDGASDRLVDALVGWGDVSSIRSRIDAHFAAGADHVCIQPIDPAGAPGPDLHALEALAPA